MSYVLVFIASGTVPVVIVDAVLGSPAGEVVDRNTRAPCAYRAMGSVSPKPLQEATMMKAIEGYRRVLGLCVLVLMAGVTALATIELGWVLVKDVITPPILFLELDELFEILGVFLLVLITLELFDSVFKTLNNQEVDHAEITLRVAIIAVARKAILLDAQVMPATKIAALAGLILALVGGTYVLARIRKHSPS